MNHQNPITTQGEALRELDPTGEHTLELIAEYACLMREIMETFAEKHGRLPDGHELVWCLGVEIGKNPKGENK